MKAEPLYHPPRLAPRLTAGDYGSYVLSVGRIESVKRVDLAVRAMQHVDTPIRMTVVGDGTQRSAVAQLAEECGVADRVEFLGQVSDDTLLELYAGALAVVYAPYDEDYGYVTLEAFLARRPEVTTRDAGGPLEFVEHGTNGAVCEPDPEAIAGEINRLSCDRARAASYGASGSERARTISWDGVVDRLVGL